MSQWRLDWPTASGPRLGTAVIRQTPADFMVDELVRPDTFTGDGEHLCLRIEKTGDNTEFVARELSRLAGCRDFDVSFFGLKDRHAVTRQWFSLYRPGRTDDQTLISKVGERWPVLESTRHIRKLRRGEHSGNHFRLCLREITADRIEVDQRLKLLSETGSPNYFGSQRFGFGGNNIEQAVKQGGRPRRGKSFRAGMAFSAARSWLFNEVLAERVVRNSWMTPIDGEPDRACVSGPLWGDGGTAATGELEALEREVVARTPEVAAVFGSTRMKPERRPLMLPLSNLSWRWPEERVLELEFSLEPGGFATSFLAEFIDVVSGDSVPKPAS
ncbi:tRNA pseudouridine(13) synthase TruD [Marinobacter sp. V034]|uniref:tRNA pseudouridine(13) synthase TruD n=1 Tax=Marinobacter sp. V034 TaxID=3459610 RepID=UPI004044467C